MYLIYKTDVWHSYNSFELIGAATTMNNAINICKAQATREEVEIDPEQIELLKNIKQTQGFEGDGEIVINEIKVNTLI